MKLKKRGKSTSSPIEITHCSSHGIWMFVGDREFFLDFETFPWFETASLKDLMNVKLLHHRFLHWEKLDLDLELESLDHPERYPLVSKAC